MRYILALIGSLTCFFSFSQDNGYEDKLAKETQSFFGVYQYYTTLKLDYSFVYEQLDKKYFRWNNENQKKIFKAEEVVNGLERSGSKELAEKVRFRYEQILRQYYTQYGALLLLEKNFRPPWRGFPYIVVDESIVDLSNFFWSNTMGNWKITSSIDTLTEYDPWQMPKPVKEDISKEVIILFYNYQDTTINRILLTSFSDSIIAKRFRISPEIYGLVNSEHYRKQKLFTDEVPPVLQKWINEKLTELKIQLPNDWANDETKRITISFELRPNETLWFKSDKEHIYISPYLVRAIYIKHIYDFFDGEIENMSNYLDKLKNGRNRTLSENHKLHLNIKADFQKHFTFILLHELSHVRYNDDKSKSSIIEYFCDCKAVEVIKANNLTATLGIFEEILIQSIKEGSANLWNIKEQEVILYRLKLLKDENNRLTMSKCNF